MSGFVWLASYPRSGNTWFRLLQASLDGDGAPDINGLASGGAISARLAFDNITLLDSALLTTEETDPLRSAVQLAISKAEYRDPAIAADQASAQPWLIKIHDGYRCTPDGRGIFAGARGAIVIVRDPRAVAASLASFLSCGVDRAIAIMESDSFSLAEHSPTRAAQLRQPLESWSSNVASWTAQTEVPVHLVRYEDLKANTSAVFRAALAFAGREITLDQAERARARTQFATLRDQEAAQGFREWASSNSPDGKRFFRRGEAEAWREELTAVQIERIEKRHGPMMATLGYAPA